jgi:uncharacterized protein (TIGR03437 family)
MDINFNRPFRREPLPSGKKRRLLIAFSILLVNVFLLGATALAESFVAESESWTKKSVESSGLSEEPGGIQTTSFLTILSQTPYITGESIRLKGGVNPGQTGTMSFYDGTTLLGSAPLKLEANGSMQAEFFTPGLSEGWHTLRAVFDGEGGASASRSVFVVNRATTVSAANYRGKKAAMRQILTTYCPRLVVGQKKAEAIPLPIDLAGVSVLVSIGAQMALAPLLYVGPGQVNHLMPSFTTHGLAKILVTSPDGSSSASEIEIVEIAPGIFTADASGKGWAAAQVLRVKSDGSSRYEAAVEYDENTGTYSGVPIDLGPETDRVFLVLYGTGFGFSAMGLAKATIGGVDANVLYAGPVESLPGLDQINLLIPLSLRGRDAVEISLTIGDLAANLVKVRIQ